MKHIQCTEVSEENVAAFYIHQMQNLFLLKYQIPKELCYPYKL